MSNQTFAQCKNKKKEEKKLKNRDIPTNGLITF